MKKKLFIILIILALFLTSHADITAQTLSPAEAFSAVTETDPPEDNPPPSNPGADPNQILTKPDFRLETVNPDVLEAWYSLEVNIPDSSLKAALLEEMNLSGPEITNRDMLEKLPKELNLSDKQISSLTGLEHAVYLESLVISGNSISDLSPLKNLFNLEFLDFSLNRVRKIPAFLFRMRKLNTLFASANNAESIESASGKNEITELDLSGNRLTNISAAETCVKLQTLNLSSNNLVSLPGSVAKLKELRYLNLFDNSLTDLPDLSALKKLEKINLEKNKFTEFPKFLTGMKSLSQINISVNNISELPETIVHLTALEILDVTMNELTDLPDFIQNITTLNTVSADLNRIDIEANREKLSRMSQRFAQFSYSVQIKAPKAELFEDSASSRPMLVWSGLEKTAEASEVKMNLVSVKIERRIEPEVTDPQEDDDPDGSSSEGQTPDAEDPDQIPSFIMLEEIKDETAQFVDYTAEPGVKYTYQITAYYTVSYMDYVDIPASASSVIHFDEMQKQTPPPSQNSILKYIIIAVLAAGAGTGVFFLIRYLNSRNGKKRSGGSKPQRKAESAKRISEKNTDHRRTSGSSGRSRSSRRPPVTVSETSTAEITIKSDEDDADDGDYTKVYKG